jgi:excisionase family DNA binding protein
MFVATSSVETRESMPAHVAIVDDDEHAVAKLAESLQKDGYIVQCISSQHVLIQQVRSDWIDVLILNVDARGKHRHELLPMIKRVNRLLPIIVTSSDDSIELATRIREQGVFYFSLKPVDITEIKLALQNALNRRYTGQREHEHHEKVGGVLDEGDCGLTLAAASDMLNVSKVTLSTCARRGELPAKKIGRRWYFSRNQLLEWFKLHAAHHRVDFGTLILETMDEGVAILDRSLKIQSCNTSYLTSHDISRENVIGEYCYRVSRRSLKPCDESICPVRQCYKKKRPVKCMHVNFDSDGNEHYCDVIALPVMSKHGRITQVLEIVRDNTEMYNTTKHLNWMMGFFVHECKGTLGTAMMGISALTSARFARAIGIQKRSEMLLSALSSLKLLYDMIRNYIISYKHEQGTLVCQTKRCHVEKDIIAPTVREYSAILSHKQLTVKTAVHGKRTIHCDPELVRIALSNLINNAIKYGTAHTQIQCVYRTSDSASELSVFNEGVGIDEDKLEDIFKKYVRYSMVGMSGTGLGLHVVRIIAEQHRGSVRAESGYIADNTSVLPHRPDVRPGADTAERVRPRRFARFVFVIPSGTYRRRREVHHEQQKENFARR